MPNEGGRDTRGISNLRRRAVLSSLSSVGVTALTGCLGDNESDDGETDGDKADNRTDNGSGSAETGNDGDDDEEDGSSDGQAEPDIEFTHPEEVQIDEAFSVELGRIAAETVEVTVRTTDFEGAEWTASATYEADGGTLDFDSTKPVEEAFGAGLTTLFQRARADTERSYFPNWNTGGTIHVTVKDGEEMLGETSVDRTYGDVTWERVDSDEFVGWLSEPPGEEPLPGVIVLHGSEGRPARGVAQMLAANGFTVLALQYFEWGNEEELLPGQLVEVPIEFVESGAEWLLDRHRVEGSQVGVWGGSKGGELALLVGSRFDTVGPVVSLNGSGYVWGRGVEGTSAWTYDDEPLAYVPFTTDAEVQTGPSPMEYKPAYRHSLEEASDDTLAEATIPVEECDGPVLLVSGGDDKLWNSVELHSVAAERLDANDNEYEHLVYEDAGHLIRYPYLPATNREESNTTVYGGTAAGYAEADADHWPRVLETFETLRNE
jgi:dienelactone hydrolase